MGTDRELTEVEQLIEQNIDAYPNDNHFIINTLEDMVLNQYDQIQELRLMIIALSVAVVLLGIGQFIL